jgi:hypothetical protein
MQRTLDLPAVEQQPPKCAIRLWPPGIQAQSLAKRMQRTDAIVDAEKRPPRRCQTSGRVSFIGSLQ